jgi:hypothetical protein
MKNERRPIDDYALAAYITGKVPGVDRDEMIDSLRDDGDARELLAVVDEALRVEKEPDEAMRLVYRKWSSAREPIPAGRPTGA